MMILLIYLLLDHLRHHLDYDDEDDVENMQCLRFSNDCRKGKSRQKQYKLDSFWHYPQPHLQIFLSS